MAKLASEFAALVFSEVKFYFIFFTMRQGLSSQIPTAPSMRARGSPLKSLLSYRIVAQLANEGSALGPARLRALREELDAIERELLRANLPNSYRKQAYTLLHHLDYIRKRGDELLLEATA
jgi:hypothetical protein